MVSCYTGFVLVQTWSVFKLLSECTILRELIARGLSTVTSTGTTVQTLHGHVWFCQGSPNTWRGPHVTIIIGSRGPLSHGVPKFFRLRVSAHGRSTINPRSSPYYWCLPGVPCVKIEIGGADFLWAWCSLGTRTCAYMHALRLHDFLDKVQETQRKNSPYSWAW